MYISKLKELSIAVVNWFFFDAKGFWIVTTTFTNLDFVEYVDAFQPWVESVGGVVFAIDMELKTVEGKRKN